MRAAGLVVDNRTANVVGDRRDTAHVFNSYGFEKQRRRRRHKESSQRERAQTIWKEGLLLNNEDETLQETLKRLRVKP